MYLSQESLNYWNCFRWRCYRPVIYWVWIILKVAYFLTAYFYFNYWILILADLAYLYSPANSFFLLYSSNNLINAISLGSVLNSLLTNNLVSFTSNFLYSNSFNIAKNSSKVQCYFLVMIDTSATESTILIFSITISYIDSHLLEYSSRI